MPLVSSPSTVPRDSRYAEGKLKTALLFPGQGSQFIGMGRESYAASPLARDLFDRADALLGFSLTSLCFDGPEADLRRTENAQPALFTVGAVIFTALRESGVPVHMAAGHSVGEYAALFAAGTLTFEAGLRLVRRRGELMAAASERAPGTMAAILGLPIELVERICASASAVGFVEVANENGPGQTVISGEVAGVESAMELAEDDHGGIAVPLAVSGAFHSRLMSPAAAGFSPHLSTCEIRSPGIPVISNVDAAAVRTPQEIRDALSRQITGRVRWSASLLALAAAGTRRIIEAGPGRSLARVARELLPDAQVLSADELLFPRDAPGAHPLPGSTQP